MPNETSTQGRPDPGPIMALSTAYWSSQVLLTANRLGLFALLGDGPLSADQVAGRLATSPRHTDLMLRACAGLGLLERDADRYSNTPAAQTFLVPGQASYLGEALRYSDDLYGAWGRLEETLRSGRPAQEPESYLGGDRDRTRHFVRGMHNRALAIGMGLLSLVDLQGRERLLDLGGGPGTFSALLVRRWPGLSSIVLDLPDVVEIAREIVAEMGAAERVQTLAGDYRTSELPDGRDAVLISGVFHRESEATCRSLIERAGAALKSGGLLAIGDVFTDGTGFLPPFAALFGINMMLTAEDGGVHCAEDVGRWMADAGFVRISVQPFPPPMPHRLVQGIKT